MSTMKDENFLDDPDEAQAELEAALDEVADAAADDVEGPAEAPDGRIAALEAERDELKDRLLRQMAETENIRKRAERDRREAEQYGGSKLARDLIGVYDNLQRALNSADDDARAAAAPVLEGVELTLRELLSVYGKHGVEIISPAEGERFDPQLHQAMFEAPVPDTEAGHIIQVMADGVRLHDRLLRPAQVGVSSGSAA